MIALMLVVTLARQEPAPAPDRQPLLVIVLPLERLTLPQTPPPPLPPKTSDLTIPTVVFVGAAVVDWTTGASSCQMACMSRSSMLPHVENPKVVVPFGLANRCGVSLDRACVDRAALAEGGRRHPLRTVDGARDQRD
jgi:hypothetical protein